MEKLIITLAMLGNVPTKALNPAIPIPPQHEICDAIESCCELGRVNDRHWVIQGRRRWPGRSEQLTKRGRYWV